MPTYHLHRARKTRERLWTRRLSGESRAQTKRLKPWRNACHGTVGTHAVPRRTSAETDAYPSQGREAQREKATECHGERPMKCHEDRTRRARTSGQQQIAVDDKKKRKSSPSAGERSADLQLVKKGGPKAGEKGKANSRQRTLKGRLAAAVGPRGSSFRISRRQDKARDVTRISTHVSTDRTLRRTTRAALEKESDFDSPVAVQRQAAMVQTVLGSSAVAVHRVHRHDDQNSCLDAQADPSDPNAFSDSTAAVHRQEVR